MKILPILLISFIIALTPVLGEFAVYNNTFEAPLCSGGNYGTDTAICTANSTILANSGTHEPNYPNRISFCQSTEENNYNYLGIDELSVTDLNGGILEAGDVVEIGWYGRCIDGDRWSWLLWYSLNPEDGDDADWTEKYYMNDLGRDECDDGTGIFSSSKTIATTTQRRFTIPNDFEGEYIAIRMVISSGSNQFSTRSNGCTSNRPLDGDDLVLKMGEIISPQINIVGSYDVTETTATISGSFSYESYNNVTAYFVVDDTNQTKTNYIKDETSSETHIQNLTGLVSGDTYFFKLCIEYNHPTYDNGSICSTIKNFTTIPPTPPDISIFDHNNITYSSASLNMTFTYQDYDDVLAYFKLNGVAEDTWNFVKDVDLEETHIYHLTGLQPETQYNYSACIDYGESYELTICTLSNNTFTTNERFPPDISLAEAYDVSGNSANLTMEWSYYDYDDILAYFVLDGDDTTKVNYLPPDDTHIVQLTDLPTNTSYDFLACIDYGESYEETICTLSTNTFTTGFIPSITLLPETKVTSEEATLNFIIDFDGATDVRHAIFLLPSYSGNTPLIPSNDGHNSYEWLAGLEPETDYTWFVRVQYTTNGQEFFLDSEEQTFTSYYENAFDDIWDTTLQGSNTAKIILGFAVLFGVIFFFVGVFGKFNMNIGVIGVVIMVIIGSVLATLMKLFPLHILLLIIVGSVLLVVAKNMFFGGAEHS